MIKAVIFDMDGLILDTEKLLVKYWCQAANEAGFPMQREHALNIRSLARKFAIPYLQGIFGEEFDYVKIRTFPSTGLRPSRESPSCWIISTVRVYPPR